MKKKAEQMSREDWEKTAACVKDLYLKSLDLSLMCSGNFGKTHYVAKKADRVYRLMSELKSELHNLAGSNAQGFFSDEEIDKMFYGD